MESVRRAQMAEAVRISPDSFPELNAVWDFERDRYKKHDVLNALRQVWNFIARFQLKEAEDCLNAVELSLPPEDAKRALSMLNRVYDLMYAIAKKR